MKTAAQIIADRLTIHEDHPAAWPLTKEWANAEAARYGDDASVLLILAHNGMTGRLQESLNQWLTARFMPNLTEDLAAVLAAQKPSPWATPTA